MSFLVLSTSLNKESKSALLAASAVEEFKARAKDCDFLDLRELNLPHCDGDTAYSHPDVARVREKIEKANCIIMAVAIYNFDCGSSAKNLLELTGKAWTDKTVGFLCAAGGKSSYMSIMGLANSLMLDFRSLILPRFVYTDGAAFANGKLVDEEIAKRISQLVDSAIKLEKAMCPL